MKIGSQLLLNVCPLFNKNQLHQMTVSNISTYKKDAINYTIHVSMGTGI
jgi:hypothetical protein